MTFVLVSADVINICFSLSALLKMASRDRLIGLNKTEIYLQQKRNKPWSKVGVRNSGWLQKKKRKKFISDHISVPVFLKCPSAHDLQR